MQTLDTMQTTKDDASNGQPAAVQGPFKPSNATPSGLASIGESAQIELDEPHGELPAGIPLT